MNRVIEVLDACRSLRSAQSAGLRIRFLVQGPAVARATRTALLAAGLLGLSSCAELIHSRVSRPEIEPGMGRPGFLLPQGKPGALVLPLWGRHGGIRMEHDGLQVTLHVVNRVDKVVGFGPWFVLPAPFIPVFWDRGSALLEESTNDPSLACGSVITVLIGIKRIGGGRDSEFEFSPAGLNLQRADGSRLQVRSWGILSGRLGRGSRPGDARRPRLQRQGVFRALIEGDIPTGESFTLEIPAVAVGDRDVSFPPVRYSAGTGWAIAMFSPI